MKIIVFSPYYPPHIGGLETHSEEFNRNLSRKVSGIVVFTPRIPSGLPSIEKKDGVTTFRFPAIDIVSNYPFPKFWSPEFWRMFRYLSQEDSSIVISRTRFFLTSFLALVFAKWNRKPIVHIEHGSDFVQLSSPFKTVIAKYYDHTLGRLVLRHSDINISISKAVQKFVRRFDRRESPIIYRGLDFDALDAIPADDSIQKKYPGKIIIATAARLYKWKGTENTIEAIRSLPENIRSEIIFLIIGDGEEFNLLKKRSTELPIEMLGRLPRERAVGILKASDIYIHSSLPGGGLSTSLLEAMYCGCAVAATPNEGADEVIRNEQNGLLVSETRTGMRSAIERLVGNEPLRKRFSEQARSDIRNGFNWETSIGKYLAIFESITKQ